MKNNDFIENIQVRKSKEKIRLEMLKVLYECGEIDEDDLSNEEIDNLVELYEEETEKLIKDTDKRKIHIQNMLKEMKK